MGAHPVAAHSSFPPTRRTLRRASHPLYEPQTRAAWLVDELLAPSSVFSGRVHVPSPTSDRGAADQASQSTPITLATFMTVIGEMLHHQSTYVQQICLPDDLIAQAVVDGPGSLAHRQVERGGRLLAGLFSHYWRAVATAFSEAWDDPHGHLLWHPRGLTAFARLGSHVVHDQVVAYDIRQHYFDAVLDRIAGTVSLAAAEHADVPLGQLSTHLFLQLAAARHAEGPPRPGIMAVPGGVADIRWGSAAPPLSPDVSSVPFGSEN